MFGNAARFGHKRSIYNMCHFGILEVVVVIASPKGEAISLFIGSNVEIASLSLAMTSNC